MKYSVCKKDSYENVLTFWNKYCLDHHAHYIPNDSGSYTLRYGAKDDGPPPAGTKSPYRVTDTPKLLAQAKRLGDVHPLLVVPLSRRGDCEDAASLSYVSYWPVNAHTAIPSAMPFVEVKPDTRATATSLSLAYVSRGCRTVERHDRRDEHEVSHYVGLRAGQPGVQVPPLTYSERLEQAVADVMLRLRFARFTDTMANAYFAWLNTSQKTTQVFGTR